VWGWWVAIVGGVILVLLLQFLFIALAVKTGIIWAEQWRDKRTRRAGQLERKHYKPSETRARKEAQVAPVPTPPAQPPKSSQWR
jgi:hypothetical protein